MLTQGIMFNTTDIKISEIIKLW